MNSPVNPAWTPRFSMVCAVVADSGRPLSRAAIVAHEHGIPAVLGTLPATSRLEDDDEVPGNGALGLVQLRKAAHRPEPAAGSEARPAQTGGAADRVPPSQ